MAKKVQKGSMRKRDRMSSGEPLDSRLGKSWKRIDIEEGLLTAGQHEFARYGFQGATMDRIATRAGMSTSNAHYYYRTKQELYIAILNSQIDDWLAALGTIDRDGDPEHVIREYILKKLELSFDNPDSVSVFTNEVLSGAKIYGDNLHDTKSILHVTRTIKQWVSEKKLARVDPLQLMFIIWAATAYYADFLPVIKALMGIDELTVANKRKIRKSLSDIVLYGILPRD